MKIQKLSFLELKDRKTTTLEAFSETVQRTSSEQVSVRQSSAREAQPQFKMDPNINEDIKAEDAKYLVSAFLWFSSAFTFYFPVIWQEKACQNK